MLYVIIGIICIVVIYVLVTYNSLIKLDNMVKEAFSTMDVYLKKRWDLIPNVVEVVKAYSEHEKETFEEVVKLRNSVYDNFSDDKKLDINNKINFDISKLMLIAESYPELKSSENYINLSNQLMKIEEEIAKARKYYNGSIKLYNNKVEMFPSNVVATIFGYKSKEMFKAALEEKQNVEIRL